MHSGNDTNDVFYPVLAGAPGHVLDVFGPTVEFLTSPQQTADQFCVMRGVIPPGVTVPLHSHDDTEDFYIVAGVQQVLTQGPRGLEWRDAHAGDYIRVPAGVPHAHRNVSDEPAIELIITTGRLGRFFRDVGRPVTATLQPPHPEEIAEFIATASRYGYILGSPDENAAVGITVPAFAGGA